MLLALCQFVQEFLHLHNKPPAKSFYEQMMTNRKRQEEMQAREQEKQMELQRKKQQREVKIFYDICFIYVCHMLTWFMIMMM